MDLQRGGPRGGKKVPKHLVILLGMVKSNDPFKGLLGGSSQDGRKWLITMVNKSPK